MGSVMAKASPARLNPSARAMGVAGPQALRAVLWMLAIALVAAVAAALLPDNPYQRWQLLENSIHKRARWIHERIHFDPEPIDIAIIGSSRFGAGLNAPLIARQMSLPEGRVVNFALPESGRNLNALVVDELYTTKRPRLLVIGVIEKPGRFGHNAFKYLAPPALLASPGHPANVKWPGDLAYLPYRQLKLTAARFFPAAMGLRTRFEPALYAGSSIDARDFLPDGAGEAQASLAELERGVRKLEAGNTPPVLPPSLADVEFGDERHYLRRILAQARAHGTRVVFVALPYYTGPTELQEQAFYAGFGPVLNAHFVADDPALFADYGHLNSRGAELASRWLAGQLPALMAGPAAPGGS
jgi:hypothetical protein